MSDHSAELSPIADPVGYPGTPITTSGLLTGTTFDPGADPEDHLASIGARRPVLAIGSNADPAQLRRKLGDDVRLPVTAVRLTGLLIGHSAHVSVPGYLPYTPMPAPAPGSSLAALLLWLDAHQLLRLDATEPTYRRLPCPLRLSARVPGRDDAVLPPPGGYDLYTGRWGALREHRGGPALPAGTQQQAYETLADRPWFRDLVPEWAAAGPETRVPAAMAALRSDPARRLEIRERLAAERGPDQPS